MRRRNKIIIGILLVVIIVLVGFVVWAETPLGPMPEAYDSLNSDSEVTVSTDRWLVFEPINSSKNIGFIVYPGGRVDYRSYAPLAHAIATEGFLTIIAPMPLNLAVFGVNAANDIINSYPQISSWAIGGHSLGGTMAAQFAYENPSKIAGLILWAAYPASGNNLSKYSLLVTTIYGSSDGLVSSSQIQDSLKLLPPTAIRVEIVGGNHAQFGWYGDQPGDNASQITRENQQSQIADASLQLLLKL
jgi:dienelactone hydrolase